MSLLLMVHSINNLSELTIDADKNWNAKEISHLASIVANMMQGDLVYYDGSTLARLPAGSPGHNLQCLGPGNNPRWS
jgi:hypothetical protein